MEGYPFITDVIKEPADTSVFGGDWHTDTMYLEKPPRATLLYALQTPPTGGDTLFVNTAAAYDALSDGMKKLIDGLRRRRERRAEAQERRQPRRAFRAASSSIAGAERRQGGCATKRRTRSCARIPRPGRKSLYVSSLHTLRFDGFTEEESRPLIN